MRLAALIPFLLFGTVARANDLVVVATFESGGLYWKAEFGSHQLPCELRYRIKGTKEWREGFPLWFDSRDHSWDGEYRGSIVHLRPGTEYEAEVRTDRESARATFSTWQESFPSQPPQILPNESTAPLLIRDSGSPDAWNIYQPESGTTATIDVENRHENCIRIEDASHIILRGLTLRGASRHAIELVGDVHDIVIEDCDISGWGSVEPDGWGRNYDSALFSRSRTLERVIVQRNNIHHPRGDSNNWAEHRPTPRDPDNRHPGGPQAITFMQSRGNHVFRHNRVWSDDDHQFNDIFGASANYSTVGFPNGDSDIYGNRLSHCWDDAIESEGANRNVRIWNNHIDKSFVAVATATTSVGPLYVWRNVVGESRRSDIGNSDEIKRGGFLKTSDRMGGGRIYVFHNTLLQPPPPDRFRNTLGCQIGMGHGGNMSNIFSRNNILHTSAKGGPFNDRQRDPQGDYDYDLYNGRLLISSHERHGIAGLPRYESLVANNDKARLRLPLPQVPIQDSPAVDAGIRLPNFNDNYVGNAPDIGAHERSIELTIQRSIIIEGDSHWDWTQARTTMALHQQQPFFLTTMSRTAKVGAHGYHDVFAVFADRSATRWSSPQPIPSLRRTRRDDGYEVVAGDLSPIWHPPTGKVLITGKTFNFADGSKEDILREKVSYCVFDPTTREFGPLRILDLPEKDRAGSPMIAPNAGCHQQVVLDDGNVLLPIRYQRSRTKRNYTSVVAKCEFDGETLRYIEHGSEHSVPTRRGLYEPSVVEHNGAFFLTLRADDGAWVAKSSDGINFSTHVPWRFDDGKKLGCYNTQQHWVTLDNRLYLVYTRKGADNDHIMRHRAPLFIGKVEPKRMVVLRKTEQIVVRENHATLGNSGICRISDNESWITVAEGRVSYGQRKGENNRVILAKLRPAN
mgnify:CR=1 FL=1|tara:strand:+ start:701120 stop:703849 length:2730 start_codon:yes stop_codon:yes gene_type:complete